MKKFLFIILFFYGFIVKGQHFTDHNLAIQIWQNCPSCIDTTTQNLLSNGLSPDNEIATFGLVVDSLLPITNWNELIQIPYLNKVIMDNYLGITELPPLPPQVKSLSCKGCNISSLNNISDSLKYLVLSHNPLSAEFPSMPASLLYFNCSNCLYTHIPSLPSGLQNLDLSHNNIFGSIANLPNGINELILSNNSFTGQIDLLPFHDIQYLDLSHNSIDGIVNLETNFNNYLSLNLAYTNTTSLPNFGALELASLDVSHSALSSLPDLSSTRIETFDVSFNNLSGPAPILASNSIMTSYRINNNNFSGTISFPYSLIQFIDISHNNFDTLINLPLSSSVFNCSYNNFSHLPEINSYQSFDCSFNNLINLPQINGSLENLTIEHNQISCLPILPNGLQTLTLDQGICLPNIPEQLALTVYNSLNEYIFYDNNIADFICNQFNQSNCALFPLVTGSIYFDSNLNGIYDAADAPIPNKVVSSQPYLQSGLSDTNGVYSIILGLDDTISILAPSINNFFSISPSQYTIITQGSPNQVFNGNDFIITPSSIGTDLAVDITAGVAVPGNDFYYDITITNIGTELISGTINLNFDPALQFVSSNSNPSIISGNIIEWNFQDLHLFQSKTINVQFYVSPFQSLGSELVASVSAFTSEQDVDTTSNLDALTTIVVASFDPNDKQVSPSIITPAEASNHPKLEYTIRFQNTGTAEAINVLVTDTLSNSLDIASLEMVASSHSFYPELRREMLPPHRQVLNFHFDNIMLPDSNTNEPLSHGFVKFRIRLADTLQIGESVGNIANIYFDFNSPVITNEALLENPLITYTSNPEIPVSLFPNPATQSFMIEFPTEQKILYLRIQNMLGETVYNKPTYQVSVEDFAKGLYLVEIETEQGRVCKKLVVK